MAEAGKAYNVTYQIRSSFNGMRPKSDAQFLDGKSDVLVASWVQNQDDPYTGERTFFRRSGPVAPEVMWISEGDLIVGVEDVDETARAVGDWPTTPPVRSGDRKVISAHR